MLHWLSLILYLLISILVSVGIYNKSLLQLLVLGEVLLIIFFITYIILASYFNIYYLISFSFFLLIFGGLELSLNILLITL